MDDKEIKYCPYCKAKMVEYRHVLNERLVHGLLLMYRKMKPINPIVLFAGIPDEYSLISNFQKLKYWGLIAKHKDAMGKHIGGMWIITEEGKEFIRNRHFVCRWVWTYRGKIRRFEGDKVSMSSYFSNEYLQREDYVETAKPVRKNEHIECEQGELFGKELL